jgi:hypothetical protein
MVSKAQIVNVAHLDDGRALIYCFGCVQGHVQPAAGNKGGEPFYCPTCREERRESVELEEAFRRGLVLSGEDDEVYSVSFRSILAAMLRDVA